MYKIKRLQSFSFKDKGGEKGSGVRDKVKSICELLENSELVAEERAKAQQIRTKLSGTGSRGTEPK